MLDRLVLFGATGDLAGRLLFPALASLAAARRLPERFAVTGAAREEWSDERFRQHVSERLHEHAGALPASVRDGLVRGLSYRHVDFDDAKTVALLVGERAFAAYLALPPAQFPRAVGALLESGLPPGSRIAVEKPFGESLESAVRLNALLANVPGGESAIFRVDHVLGMPTVQNLLGLRLASRVLEPLWSAAHVELIEILWEETLALEGRAAFYDGTGALRDVMQNHMMQLLALVAMEPPASLDVDEVRRAKVELLRAVRPPRTSEIATRTRRARYAAGRVGERRLPAYEQEAGVDGSRGTETFAEIVLEIGNDRWAGARVVLRAGKALAERKKEIVVRFRPATRWASGGTRDAASELRIGIDGPFDIRLRLTGIARDGTAHPVPVVLEGAPPHSELPAYGHVLADLLDGGNDLSLGASEVEEAWRIVTPILRAWAAGAAPLQTYPAGSVGPE
jgi:glucose-6-phosphate 1-dehydrogenase